MIERTPAVTIHGRYLLVPADKPGPAPLLVGFHGYAEDAEIQLERLRSAAAGQWHCLSIQALHRFYQRRGNQVVAGWMTRQHRELAIADNLAYVQSCLSSAAGECAVSGTAVFAGFSQGVAMAFRAAVASDVPAAGVIALGGDVPPEIPLPDLARLGSVLIARGTADGLYPELKFTDDQRRLRESSTHLTVVEFDGGHEWSPQVAAAATEFLARLAA